jgi:hypothetical protein
MPVSIVSLLSTMHTGDVSNRGGSKTKHTGRVTLQEDTSRKFKFVEKGTGEFFCILTNDYYSGQNKGTEKHLDMNCVN